MASTQPLQSIADKVGLDDPLHQPEKRGIMRLLSDLETGIHAIGPDRRHGLFVIRHDDLEAVLGAMKCAKFAQQQMKGRAKP